MTAIDQRGQARRCLIRRAITIASCAVSLSLAGSFAMAAPPGIVVGDSAQLLAALQRVRGGETILLRPGVGYRALVINVRPDAEVVIRSLDPERRGIIAGLDLRAVRNLTFDTLRFADEGTQARKHYDIRVTNTTAPSADIVIHGNVFKSGQFQSQVIFFRDQLGDLGKGEMRYRNVLIEKNIIHNNNYHGITLASTDVAIIQDNRRMPHARQGRSSSINVLKSTKVVIRDNVAPRMNIADDNKSVLLSGNLLQGPRR